MTTSTETFTLEQITTAVDVFVKLRDHLSKTLLLGWPHKRLPTIEEAIMIIGARNEIMLHLPDVSEDQAWEIAGNIAARQTLALKRTEIDPGFTVER